MKKKVEYTPLFDITNCSLLLYMLNHIHGAPSIFGFYIFPSIYADMAPKILKSFGAVKNDKSSKESKGDEARLQKVIPKIPIPQPSPIPKRKEVMDLTDDTAKRQKREDAPSKNSTLALNHQGPLASVFVKDDEVRAWEVMILEEATKAFIKASAQLMYHSMHNIDRIVAERARLTQLEGNNTPLKR